MKKLWIGGVLTAACVLSGLLAGASAEQVTIFLLAVLAGYLAFYREGQG